MMCEVTILSVLNHAYTGFLNKRVFSLCLCTSVGVLPVLAVHTLRQLPMQTLHQLLCQWKVMVWGGLSCES